MGMNENKVSLRGGTSYLTGQPMDAYKVTEGTVLIYIVPCPSGKPGRRSFLYEAKKGETIPSFSYQDGEYRNWCFCFSAMEEASFLVIEHGSTSVLRDNFAKKTNLSSYELEGYENSLVDYYENSIVAEDAFIHKTGQEKSTTAENTNKLIYNAFHKTPLVIHERKSTKPLYEAANILCKYMKIPLAPLDKIEEACGKDFSVSDVARISHFSYRQVILEENWHKRDSGALLVFDKEQTPYVCLPKGTSSYVVINGRTGARTRLTGKLAAEFQVNGYMFYRPFPTAKMNHWNLFHYCADTIRRRDLVSLLAFTLVGALIGVLLPTLNQQIYDTFIPLGENTLLMQLCSVIAAFMIGNVFFSVVKSLANFRLVSRMTYSAQHALYDRLFNLPESFFCSYESADLAGRVMGMTQIVNTAASVLLTAIVLLITMMVYFARMIQYSGKLAMAALIMVVIYGILLYLLSMISVKYETKAAGLQGASSSKLYQLLNGIEKIRIAGVEDRALYEYLKPFTENRKMEYKIGTIHIIRQVIALAAQTLFSMVLYYIMIRGNLSISVGAFIGFNAAFGAFSSAIMQLVEGTLSLNEIKPLYKRVLPVLQTQPEFDEGKELPGALTGELEVSNLTFSYKEGAAPVLDDISLSIGAGEYVGIVGPSGCGKSTLLKLLLGFEKPSAGRIYYDGKDVETLDKRELRKKFGIVLQEGKLISGSIFENITITAPKTTMQEVKEVVGAVGLAEDIEEMPMGLHTVLSEDCGTISGGQQQRILIARAIIGKPALLFLDEATSALDNVTQSMVCDTLEKMKTTRIVIAHRLSTVIHCDRILVMDQGKVVEQGNYQQLMEKQGLFYTLASRQIS